MIHHPVARPAKSDMLTITQVITCDPVSQNQVLTCKGPEGAPSTKQSPLKRGTTSWYDGWAGATGEAPGPLSVPLRLDLERDLLRAGQRELTEDQFVLSLPSSRETRTTA